MISICEHYAKTHSITFKPNKSKLLCYNVDEAVDIPPPYLNGEVIPSVGSGSGWYLAGLSMEQNAKVD